MKLHNTTWHLTAPRMRVQEAGRSKLPRVRLQPLQLIRLSLNHAAMNQIHGHMFKKEMDLPVQGLCLLKGS